MVQGLPLVQVLQQSHCPLWVSRACLSRHSCSSCLSWRNCYVEEMDIRLTSAQEEPAACRVRALAFFQGSIGCRHSPPPDWSIGDSGNACAHLHFTGEETGLQRWRQIQNKTHLTACNASAPAPRPQYLWQLSLSSITLDHGLPGLYLLRTKVYVRNDT